MVGLAPLYFRRFVLRCISGLFSCYSAHHVIITTTALAEINPSAEGGLGPMVARQTKNRGSRPLNRSFEHRFL